MQGEIRSINPQCKCGSYMVFPKERNGRMVRKCKVCGRFRYEQSRWTDIFERLMLWKS